MVHSNDAAGGKANIIKVINRAERSSIKCFEQFFRLKREHLKIMYAGSRQFQRMLRPVQSR